MTKSHKIALNIIIYATMFIFLLLVIFSPEYARVGLSPAVFAVAGWWLHTIVKWAQDKMRGTT